MTPRSPAPDLIIGGVLFDKDGTLIDFDVTWAPAYRAGAVFLTGGDEALADTLLAATGWNADEATHEPGSMLAAGTVMEIVTAWTRLMPAHRRPADPLNVLSERVDAVFERVAGLSVKPFTDLPALMARLRARGLAVGLATNDSVAGARSTLGPVNAIDCFDFFAGFDSGHGHKPGPGMVHGFCDAMGLVPHRVMVVGDSLHDLRMARAAGAGAVVGVLSGTGAPATLAAEADNLIPDINHLESLLDRIEQAL
ncbi:MAG: HAD family hydrolase [Rhodobacterales bacterium]|nr:HAD family hydrolase [Rhodobacterales bacterium]